MPMLKKPLRELTAADLMSHPVVAIPRGMTLQGAIRVLVREQVSGAPVVNDDGRCIGVVSTRDILRWAEKAPEALEEQPKEGAYVPDWQINHPEVWPPTRVGEYMTADPVTASPTTRLRDLARRMIDAAVHRIVVTDSDGVPVGIVSSMDIVAAVARSEDEEF